MSCYIIFYNKYGLIVIIISSCRDYGLEMVENTYTAEDKGNHTSFQQVMLKGSMREKFLSTFIINSANLRMRDTIGEGWGKHQVIKTYSWCIYTILHNIMAGEFGIVYKGYLIGHDPHEVVAVKTLKGRLLIAPFLVAICVTKFSSVTVLFT